VKVLSVFGTCLLLFAALVFMNSESYFPLYPTIDTRLPKGFSEEKFRRIVPGMTKAEVAAILPGSPEPESDLWKETGWQYGDEGRCNGWCDLAWLSFGVQFDETEKVIETTREIYMN